MDIIREANVNRLLLPEAVIIETGWRSHFVRSALASIPRGEGIRSKVVFFPPDRTILSHADLFEEYDARKLLYDPRASVAVNRDDPFFARECPNLCPWLDELGRCCFMSFDFFTKAAVQGTLVVNYHEGNFSAPWRYAGVSKS